MDKELKASEKKEIVGEVYRLLAKLEDNYEIIIKSYASFERMKKFVGSYLTQVSQIS